MKSESAMSLQTIGTKESSAAYLSERLHSAHSTWERVSERCAQESLGDPGIVQARTSDKRYFVSVNSIGIAEYLSSRAIRMLLDNPPALSPKRYFDSDLNKMQRKGLRSICQESISVINGLPGVGKTFLVRSAARHLESIGKRVVGCAFVGSAAERISSSAGIPAKTVHMLLGYDGISFTKNESNPISYDHVFLDEGSQVDAVLFSCLIRALKPGSSITILGDTNQIGSVAPGNVLRDLIKCVPTTTLDQMVRADAQSPIGNALIRMLDGMPPETYGSTSEGGVFFKICDDDSLPLLCFASMNRICEIEKISIFGHRSLSYTNEMASAINRHCLSKLGGKTEIPVIARKNNYSWGYFNGESARLASDGRTVLLSNGSELRFSGDFESGFASTINVAQGQQFRGVSLVVPNKGIGIPNKNFAITALTRAEKWALIGGSHRKFTESLEREDFNRVSLLAELVSGSASILKHKEI